MKFKAFVYVTLKAGYSDPEGETTAHALRGLGYSVDDVRSSKAYEVSFEAADRAKAEKLTRRDVQTPPHKPDKGRLPLRDK